MNISVKDNLQTSFSFGTKAETLERIKPFLKEAVVDELYYFMVKEWSENETAILKEIVGRFSVDEYLAIRSSAQGEDSHEQSMAGAFHSCLAINCLDTQELKTAINKVMDSFEGNGDDQILIQPMVNDIAASGVIMTRNLEDGAPYYVINYDDFSGRTDSITGGTGVHKTVLISRQSHEHYVESFRVRGMLNLVQEVEGICGSTPLDIEFGMTQQDVFHLFQVRPISVQKNWHQGIENRVVQRLPLIEKFVKQQSQKRKDILGEKTILATMPDWNPAEMIGVTPRPLASSLYRELITKDIWRLSRQEMGYRELLNEELMFLIEGHPYIDVRNSFNSFLPEGLEESIGVKLINGWLKRLDQHPEFHDKIEFEVAQTCLDFTFEEDMDFCYSQLLSSEEKKIFQEALVSLTKLNLSLQDSGSLAKASSDIDQLAKKQFKRKRQEGAPATLEDILSLVEECKTLGTLPFAVIARHAFIAESLLRSAVRRDVISGERVKAFRMSLRTITSQLALDMKDVCEGKKSRDKFIKRYGHLRPGTYDITSLCYADREELFEEGFISQNHLMPQEFILTQQEITAIDGLLKEARLDHFDTKDLFEYARRAITGREYGKFIFTKNISDILEVIAEGGKAFNLDREDLSFLTLEDILQFLSNQELKNVQAIIEKNKEQFQIAKELKLGYIIRGVGDVYVVPVHRSASNFIGSQRLEGRIVLVDTETSVKTHLEDKIVCIESADPGFDWIFTKGIKGLITKYGGSNSHMAIRCAEFGLPAAIGCGEGTFERVVNAGIVELDGAHKVLRPLHVE